ncbi:MAG: hypothetical protein HFF00_09655 [Ruminiclostridium sp.]|nr:hypothetical protein [Ruminiclostridium sp.]
MEEMSWRFCPSCGKVIGKGVSICPNCKQSADSRSANALERMLIYIN